MKTFEPLRYPLFRRMWSTSIVFNVGHTMHVVAANWLMLELTGSPLWVGLMVAAPNLPLLLLAVPSGAMSDMVDRRRVLLASSVLMLTSAATMAVLWVVGLLTAPLLLTLGIVVGVGIAFYVPAWQAIVPNLVPRPLVPRAVSLNSASGAVSLAAGPALGGALVGLYGPGVPFTVSAGSYVVMAIGVLTVRGVRWRDEAASSMRVAMATGIRYLLFSAGYRWLLLVTAAFGTSSAALRGMLPNVTSDRLVSGASTYGFLLGAMGIGALIGAIFREQGEGALGRNLAAWSILIFGASGVVVGASPVLWATAVSMALAGVAWTWVVTTLNSIVQLLAPAWVRARALSVYVLAIFGFVPIGTVIAGVLGDMFGAATSLVICSVAVMLLGVATLRKPLPDPSKMPEPDPVSHTVADDHPTLRSTGRVAIITTWEVADDDVQAFADVMDELRRVRLRTGAFRWTLYRDAMQPSRFTELFEVYTWDQHLQQHGRLDVAALEVIQRAISFDRHDSPRTFHLVAADRETLDDPQWQRMDLAAHDELHRMDGSIPVASEPGEPPGQVPPTGAGHEHSGQDLQADSFHRQHHPSTGTS